MTHPIAPAGASRSAEHGLAELVEAISARLEAGEAIDVSACVAAHPEHADELRRLLPALQVLADFSRSGSASVPPPALGVETAVAAGRLGDFDIVREVGRGGMGIVYEAEQVSLGRRVALKVLPFAATLDPRQLQRFHTEARAAAGLHHTNIVPVYAVGCERGVHYYAMQFIDGRTLADFIAERRGGPPSQVPTTPEADAAAATTSPPAAQATSPAPRDAAYFRRVAEWGIQAAEALDCAHAVGVVHRDVKPANLLVDGSGRLWVTDFGLAQVQSDARLTMTGDLVGTLRYMSLEQALGKRVVIDHRTDIYSLGATLYELLTLQPAFDGADREELLRQIAFEEPRRPRRLNKAIPAELETIVLKSLETNPAERYSTAQELADDLGRWLRDEPIRARRPSLVQRARKWCWRHRPVAIGLAAALAAAAVLAVVMGFWYQRRLADTEGGVSAALAEAQMLVNEGDKQTDHPERWLHTAQLALAAQVRAEKLLAAGVATEAVAARIRQCRAAVDAAVTDSRLLVELDGVRLEQAAVKDGHFDHARAATLYAKLLAEYGVDLAAPEAAAARVRDSRLREALLGALTDWQRGSPDEGEQQRLATVRQLVQPSDSLHQRLWAATRRRDGAELAKLVAEPSFQDIRPATVVIMAGALREKEAWAAAEQLLRAGLERHPEDFWLNHELGWVLQKQQPPRAEEGVGYLRVALALRPDSPGVQFNLGSALLDAGDVEGAIRRYRAALKIDPAYAAVHDQLGTALAAKGRLDEAIDEHREAIRLTRDNARENARAHCDLGKTLCDGKHDYDGAIAEFREALGLQADYPEAHTNLGNALLAKGRLDDAIAEYQEALASKQPFREAYLAHSGLGDALGAKGRLDEAIDEHREAIRLTRDNAREKAMAHCNLGATLCDRKHDYDGAIAEFREAIRLNPDYATAHFNLGNALYAKGQLDDAIIKFREALCLQRDHPNVHYNLGNALIAKGRLDEAIVAYRTALRLKEDYPDAHYNLGNVLFFEVRLDEAIAEYRKALGLRKDWPEAHTNLGEALAAKGRLDEAITEYQRALATKGPFPQAYEAHAELGVALADKGRLDEAIGEYRKAILLKKDEPETHFNLGNALYARGRVGEAIVAYQVALGLKENYPAAHYNLGIVRGAKGQLEEAFAEFVEANRLDPTLPDPLSALARALAMHPNAELCKPRQAVAGARKAVQTAPNQGDCWKTLGVALYRACDTYSAVAALTKSIELRKGGDASDSFFLAMAVHELGRRAEARQHYDRAVAWLEQNKQELRKDPQLAEELRRFRDEAEQVLELKKK
jgi:tetratricopeptide (TPR) repeat protein